MTPEQLQQMSRDLARLLPKSWRISGKISMPNSKPGEAWFEPDSLHESTEACAEIMVRVLLPAHIKVYGTDGFVCANLISERAHPDPMQAFRTAVCLAAIKVLSKEKV